MISRTLMRPWRHTLTLLLLATALAGCTRETPPPFNGVDITGASYARDLHLQDPEGRERSLADFRGKAVLVFFGFTQCPDVCPAALARAVEVRHRLGDDASRLQVLFVTVDPERDTPPVLKAYTEAFDPDFIGLTGTPEQIAATAKEFKIFYAKVPNGDTYTMDHSASTYAFDARGRLRLLLRHNQDAEAFTADVRRLLETG